MLDQLNIIRNHVRGVECIRRDTRTQYTTLAVRVAWVQELSQLAWCVTRPCVCVPVHPKQRNPPAHSSGAHYSTETLEMSTTTTRRRRLPSALQKVPTKINLRHIYAAADTRYKGAFLLSLVHANRLPSAAVRIPTFLARPGTYWPQEIPQSANRLACRFRRESLLASPGQQFCQRGESLTTERHRL